MRRGAKLHLSSAKTWAQEKTGALDIHLLSAYPVGRERFLRMCAQGLGDMIDAGSWDGDWFFQLDGWLPKIAAIANHLSSSEVGATYIPEDDYGLGWGQIVHSVVGKTQQL